MNTDTILDSYEKQNPRHWWQIRRPPTALQLAVAELEESRRNYLDHTGKAEYHKSMQDMLKKRITRLQSDIAELSAAVVKEPDHAA